MRYNSHIVRWSIQTVGEIVLYDAQMSCTNMWEDPFNGHKRNNNPGKNGRFANFRIQDNKIYYD